MTFTTPATILPFYVYWLDSFSVGRELRATKDRTYVPEKITGYTQTLQHHRKGITKSYWNSKLCGNIIAAVDINTIANEVYAYNFPNTNLLNRNIQSIKVNEITKSKIDTILMSPPCQPFTRNGKNLDSEDNRTNSFIHIINMLENLQNIDYILMENVKGFESSIVRNLFIEKLKMCNFHYQEFLLCPSTVGIPNSRLRYYCIARKTQPAKPYLSESIMYDLPNVYEKPYILENVIENSIEDSYLVPEKMLKRGNILDICHKDSNRSCCFTKAYSHYVEGTGSVFTNADPQLVTKCYQDANNHQVGSEDFVDCIKPLQLRFFTPKEILRLMAFPNEYKFPSHITRKQCYRLLGNSVNVKIISELLKILFE